ncbi:MAG: DUF1659 domain-containing protein [Bacillota bacterium]
MAVTSTPLISRMQLRLSVGFDGSGNPVMRTRSYANIKPGASDEAVFETGQNLADFQEHTLEAIRRVDEFELEEE